MIYQKELKGHTWPYQPRSVHNHKHRGQRKLLVSKDTGNQTVKNRIINPGNMQWIV